MRKIKFRAWDKAHEKMLLGSELNMDVLMFTETINFYQDPYYALMQYTGLKDKNGVEIYEGDIIKEQYEGDPSHELWEVIFELGCFIGIRKNRLGKRDLNSRLIAESFEQFEVIGNIYENPELLK